MREVQSGSSTSDRDADVVETIEQEGLSVFTFDGIRRLTGSHPETLSRALARLEEEGLIVRSPEGYSTTGKAKDLVALRPAFSSARRMPVLRTYLPPGVKASSLVSALKGRWFDRLRWVGMAEGEDGVVLKWVTEDGKAVIDARLTRDELEVEARVDEDDFAGAVRAAYQLVARISKIYASPRSGGRLMLMRVGYFPAAM